VVLGQSPAGKLGSERRRRRRPEGGNRPSTPAGTGGPASVGQARDSRDARFCSARVPLVFRLCSSNAGPVRDGRLVRQLAPCARHAQCHRIRQPSFGRHSNTRSFCLVVEFPKPKPKFPLAICTVMGHYSYTFGTWPKDAGLGVQSGQAQGKSSGPGSFERYREAF
jgi:hypothetical protein